MSSNELLNEIKAQVEELRNGSGNEFEHLSKQVYLDHAANAIYMQSLIKDFYSSLTTSSLNQNTISSKLFSNPHSHSQSGLYTNAYINLTREKILSLFNTNSNEYDVVFVSNATQALKLVAESFNFDECGSFAYLNDNHTSVIGMREIVSRLNPSVNVYSIFEKDVICSDEIQFKAKLLKRERSEDCEEIKNGRSLFVYPAQSNFNGRKYSLDLVEKVQKRSIGVDDDVLQKRFEAQSWFVCLDAASYVSSSKLDLAKFKPDFVVTSFYKIFGFPTGIGTLLIRKCEKVEAVLRRNYFGGGTLSMALIDEAKFKLKESSNYDFHEAFEDGTCSYLEIIGVNLAIERFSTIFKKDFMTAVEIYLKDLCVYFVNLLESLKHFNGKSLVEMYRNKNSEHGPIIAFNLKNSDDKYISFNLVNKLAQQSQIHLRVGCFCNIGACQMHLRHLRDNKSFLDNFKIHGHKCGDHIDLINDLPTGAIRVSLGYCSIQRDIDAFIEFLRNNFVENFDENLQLQLSGTENRTRKEQYFKISKLFIYPVKSCAPLEIHNSWQLCDSGFLYDRNWILIDSNQIPLTQKRLPQLAALQPQIDIKRNLFILIFDEHRIEIPLEIDDIASVNKVNVCAHKIFGYDCGDEVAQWLQEVFQLNEPIRLVKVLPKLMDELKCDLKANEKKNFVNQADFLLISLNSIRKLREFLLSYFNLESKQIKEEDLKLIDDELVKQFRANFVIEVINESSACDFDEEKWNKMRILNRDLQFMRTNLCSRCQMINLNQNINAKKDEDENLNETENKKSLADTKVCFNQLLKQLYKLKTNSKFGIYISQLNKNENLEPINEPNCSESSILVEKSLIKMRKNEVFIGDIGIADFI